MNENKKKLLLERYGEIGICKKCSDYMIWKKKDHQFHFQNKKIVIKNMNFLICTNQSCNSIGVNGTELEVLEQKAKRRLYLTGITESEAEFLKKYND